MGSLKKELIIFGSGKMAEAVSYYFERDSDYKIVAYVNDDDFNEQDSFLGKPVVTLSKVVDKFPPSSYMVFVAVGYQELNSFRSSRYKSFKDKGYGFANYVSPYVKGDFAIGQNSIIMDNVAVQPKASIGDNVFVWGGAMLGHHSTIKDHCWITGGCLIGGSVTIGESTFLGLGTTIVQEVTIGRACILGASTLITKDLPDNSVIISPDTDKFRLNSKQFVKMSKTFRS